MKERRTDRYPTRLSLDSDNVSSLEEFAEGEDISMTEALNRIIREKFEEADDEAIAVVEDGYQELE
jgi:hypothetical protein